MENSVTILRTNGYNDMKQIISKAIENIGKLKLPDGSRVLVKINLCSFRAPSSGAITHPLFLDALLCYLRNGFNDLDITVIESDATGSIPDVTLKWFGFDKILEKWNVKWYNLSRNPTINKKIKGLYSEEMEISEIFGHYDYFISVSKLKTHSITRMTAALKNQFGCIPYKRKVIFHKNIHSIIADANLAMTPDLCFVDGIISMVGGGAIFGVPIKSDILIAGKDPVSVDAVCAKILGYNPRKIEYIQKCRKLKVGKDKFILAGDIKEPKEVQINREFPFYKDAMISLGRYIQNRHSVISYYKKLRI